MDNIRVTQNNQFGDNSVKNTEIKKIINKGRTQGFIAGLILAIIMELIKILGEKFLK